MLCSYYETRTHTSQPFRLGVRAIHRTELALRLGFEPRKVFPPGWLSLESPESNGTYCL